MSRLMKDGHRTSATSLVEARRLQNTVRHIADLQTHTQAVTLSEPGSLRALPEPRGVPAGTRALPPGCSCARRRCRRRMQPRPAPHSRQYQALTLEALLALPSLWLQARLLVSSTPWQVQAHSNGASVSAPARLPADNPRQGVLLRQRSTPRLAVSSRQGSHGLHHCTAPRPAALVANLAPRRPGCSPLTRRRRRRRCLTAPPPALGCRHGHRSAGRLAFLPAHR